MSSNLTESMLTARLRVTSNSLPAQTNDSPTVESPTLKKREDVLDSTLVEEERLIKRHNQVVDEIIRTEDAEMKLSTRTIQDISRQVVDGADVEEKIREEEDEDQLLKKKLQELDEEEDRIDAEFDAIEERIAKP